MPVFVLTDSSDTFPTFQDSDGDDTVYGQDGMDQIDGGDGNDVLYGGLDRDTLTGGSGNDYLDAGLLPLDDVLDGGIGNDTASIELENAVNVATGVSVRVVAEAATIAFSVIIDGIVGPSLSNIENFRITSGNANDRLIGAAGNDTLTSLGGNDRIAGGAGNDWIDKTWGRYDLDGGDGIDRLLVSFTDRGLGAAGLVFDAAAGTITSGAATTGTFRRFELYSVLGTGKADTVTLGRGDDTAIGAAGADVLTGNAGDDLLDGGAGRDTLFGGDGNDTLYGQAAVAGSAQEADQVEAGAGNDLIFVYTTFGAGITRLTYAGARFDGGQGTADELEFDSALVTIDLSQATLAGIEKLTFGTTFQYGLVLTTTQAAGLGEIALGTGYLQFADNAAVTLRGSFYVNQFVLADGGQSLNLSDARRPFATFVGQVTGGTGNDTVEGSRQADRMLGGDGNDILRGNRGNDALTGQSGRDTLNGGVGDDVLTGGSDVDRIEGGAGADQFQFIAITDSGAVSALADVIVDFTLDPADSTAFIDRINLAFIDANADGGGSNDTFTFVGTGGFTAAGQVRVRAAGADTLVEVNTTGTGGAEMVIRLLGVNAATVGAVDFVL